MSDDRKRLDRPRSWEEIVAEIERLVANHYDDLFGTMRQDLMAVLPFKHVKPYIKDDVTEKGWESEARQPYSRYTVCEWIKEYLEFAWSKANDCCGLSAQRSLHHLRAWFFLLGEESFVDSIDYEHYGKPCLVAISERDDIGFPWTKHDNDQWRNDERDPSISAREALGR